MILSYTPTGCHISKLTIYNYSSFRMCVYINERQQIYLDDYTRTYSVDLRTLNINENEDFTVTIEVSGNPNVIHSFVCHYSRFSDASLSINANIQNNNDRMTCNLEQTETDHANNHIRYFSAKINGIYLARINIRYKIGGVWYRQKSNKHKRKYVVYWDCGVGELNLPDNTEVQLQLDIVGGHTRNARETFFGFQPWLYATAFSFFTTGALFFEPF